jgi:uncharacterized protein (TIGR02147 family)
MILSQKKMYYLNHYFYSFQIVRIMSPKKYAQEPSNPQELSPPEIFNYLDYRKFMKDFYDYKKRTSAHFSQRLFIKLAGLPISCSSLYPAIVKGKRGLSQSLKTKFSKAYKFSEKEAQYFSILVDFNQAKETTEKNHYFEHLSRFHHSKAQTIHQGQYEFFSKWYHSVVWNYIGMNPHIPSLQKVASNISPSITVTQLKQSIQLLLHLDLIEKTANGYQVTNNHIRTEKDVEALIAKKNIQELTEIGLNILDTVPANQRQYNTLTFSVSKSGMQTIKERIRNFQEELRDVLDNDQNEDRIYTLNIQLFPNSRNPQTS